MNRIYRKEGRRVVVDIYNDTDTPEQFHWHGQTLPSNVDGAAEEGTPFIPAHGMRRFAFAPGPAGFRFYHTHTRAGADLNAGQYNGQVGPVYIEPRHEPGAYDREIFLVLKELLPSFSKGGDMAMDFLAPSARVKALEAPLNAVGTHPARIELQHRWRLAVIPPRSVQRRPFAHNRSQNARGKVVDAKNRF